MFAVAFDLVVEHTLNHHPRGVPQAYGDIRRVLSQHGFEWTQGSVYITRVEDLSRLTRAMVALKGMPWFPLCARDIHAFRVELWSDFTDFIKS